MSSSTNGSYANRAGFAKQEIIAMMIITVCLFHRYGFVTFETQEDAQKIIRDVSTCLHN